MPTAPGALARLRRFGRDEEGSMVIFALFVLVMMLMVGGMAVDMMRQESNRARLQGTLDRAVLAAADLDQTMDAEAVVRDYVEKAGLLENLSDVVVTETFNSRTVGATAAMELDTIFMDLVGVPTLVAPAASRATESISDIEIVLVLDVSGSMLLNNRMTHLRSAARTFVQDVLEDDEENRISIAVVPFNGQVNLGPQGTVERPNLADMFNVTGRPAALYGSGFSFLNCVDLPAPAYASQTLSRTAAMPATAMADTFTTTDTSNTYRHYSGSWGGSTYGQPVATNMWCPARDGSNPSVSTAGNVVRLPSNDIATLQSQIGGMVAVGATSINAGMRWGMTLLDPASQPMFSTLVSANRIPGHLAGRPYAFDREDTLKVIVLMTDGEHFMEERVNEGFRSGASPIWQGDDDYYSSFHNSKVNRASASTIAASRPFYVPHLNQWHARAWNGTAPASSVPYVEGDLRRFDRDGDNDCDNADDGRGALKAAERCYWDTTQQTWPQVWTELRLHWVAFQLFGRALTTSAGGTGDRNAITTAQMNLFRTRTATTDMDAQLQQMCGRARDANILVYGIAFEAPTNGDQQIAACASSSAHYYAPSGGDIRGVFTAIAASINALRLVQTQ